MKALLKRIRSLPPPLYGDEDDLDYTSLGFTAADAESLAEIAKIEPGEEEWDETREHARTYALRILATVGGVTYFETFFTRFELAFLSNDRLACEDFPMHMEKIGPEAIAPLRAILCDENRTQDLRGWVAEALGWLGRNPRCRKVIVDVFARRLDEMPSTRFLNGILMSFLAEWKTTEQIDLIRNLYHANLVDVSFAGDLEQVEIDLGLRSKRTTEEPDLEELEEMLSLEARRGELGPPPETDQPLDVLEYYLALYGNQNSLASVAHVHGFLLGCILSPNLVPPSKFIPRIWDMEEGDSGQQPAWKSEPEVQQFYAALMETHNEIIASLQAIEYDPMLQIVVSGGSERTLFSPWAIGLLAGARFWSDSGRPQSTRRVNLMTQLMEVVEREAEGVSPEEESFQHCVILILSEVHYLYTDRPDPAEFTSPHAPPLAWPGATPIDPIRGDAPKVGRNDPCPCGSGKKYKKCCMN